MTDPDAAPAGAPDPITVKATMTPVVMSETTKAILVAGLAALADHFMKSETALAAVLAASGAVATALWGVWSRVRTWGALRHLADLVDDSIAVVGKHRP